MVPAASRERPSWLPVVGVALLLLVLLGASGYFFNQWWKERQAWQPYAETPEEAPATNNLPAPKTTQIAKQLDPVAPPTPKTTATNPPPEVVTPPPTPTNPPPQVAVVPPPPQPVTPPPPAPVMTNPVPAVTPPPVTPPAPVPPPVVTNPPPATTPAVATTQTVLPPTNSPPASIAKKPDEPPTKVAALDFPDLKLQGIIRAKKKTTAIVNGKTLSLGDRLEGAFLLKIDQESVTFEKGSVKREFFLLR